MSQLTLALRDISLPFKRDSDTSRAAAAKARPKAPAHRTAILGYLLGRGTIGATNEGDYPQFDIDRSPAHPVKRQAGSASARMLALLVLSGSVLGAGCCEQEDRNIGLPVYAAIRHFDARLCVPFPIFREDRPVYNLAVKVEPRLSLFQSLYVRAGNGIRHCGYENAGENRGLSLPAVMRDNEVRDVGIYWHNSAKYGERASYSGGVPGVSPFKSENISVPGRPTIFINSIFKAIRAYSCMSHPCPLSHLVGIRRLFSGIGGDFGDCESLLSVNRVLIRLQPSVLPEFSRFVVQPFGVQRQRSSNKCQQDRKSSNKAIPMPFDRSSSANSYISSLSKQDKKDFETALAFLSVLIGFAAVACFYAFSVNRRLKNEKDNGTSKKSKNND